MARATGAKRAANEDRTVGRASPRPAPAAAAAPARLPTWATVSTMKETPDTVMNFIAHHLLLGASEIIIYFDDPDDPAIPVVERVPRVRAIRCDADFVASRGRHPSGLPARQKIHARLGYALTRADWIIHIDADEFIQADRPVAGILAGAAADVVRLAPFEALATPRAARDGRPEHYYRGALPDTRLGARLAQECYGPFEACLSRGMLSHLAGKFFVRTGIDGMALAVHGPFLKGDRADHQDSADMRLLHFHGGVYATWRRHLDRRLSDDAGGTYSGRLASHGGPASNMSLLETLQHLHRTEGEAGLERFFRAACTYGPEKRALRRVGALISANLWADAKRTAVFGGSDRLTDAAFDPETGTFEASLAWEGLTLRLAPDRSYPECQVARGQDYCGPARGFLRERLADRPVRFADLDAGAGLLALFVARHAAKGSAVAAFSADPAERERARRNAVLNPGLPVTVADDPLRALRSLAAAAGSAAPLRLVLVPGAAPGPLADAVLAAAGQGAAPDIILLGGPRREAILASALAADLAALGYAATDTPGLPVILERNPHRQN